MTSPTDPSADNSRSANLNRRTLLAVLAAGPLLTASSQPASARTRSTQEGEQANKQVMRQFFAAIEAGNFDRFDDLVAEDATGHGFPGPADPQNRAEYVEFFRTLRSAFPDLEFTEEHVVAENEFVASHWTFTGTHRDTFIGIPPTGNHVTVAGISLDRIENERIAESWIQFDTVEFWQQLGVIDPDTVARNTAVVQQFYQALNAEEFEAAFAELVADNHVSHGFAAQEEEGREALVQFVAYHRATLSGLRYTVDDMVAGGDNVAVRWTATGTHTGEFLGLPPSGNDIVWPGITIHRVEDGQIAESWPQSDLFGVVNQMGVVVLLPDWVRDIISTDSQSRELSAQELLNMGTIMR